jgi:YHS domain-containing protein
MTKNLLMSTALLFAGAALAEKALVEPVNKNRSGIAVEGYDVVAYFTQSAPVKGDAKFTANWQGATWRFSSEQNRNLFQAKPEQYAPQYGGYCAWAVGHGYTAEIDPNAWKIIDGKLYLNYSKSVQSKWQPEAWKWISEANRNWPGLHK